MLQARDVTAFSSVLKSRGAGAALAYLNEGVPHRFSGVYRIDEGNLRNVLLVDKQGQMRPAFLEVVPMDTSFCQFVVRDGLFRTNNSATDARLDGHPYQGVVVSYHAVPLVDPDRALVGTLSHFDLIERSIKDSEFELLYQAGHLLSDFIPF
jgi:GAF domain-containing protein